MSQFKINNGSVNIDDSSIKINNGKVVGDQYSKKKGATIARGRSISPSYLKLGEWGTVGDSDELIDNFDSIASAVDELLKIRGQR